MSRFTVRYPLGAVLVTAHFPTRTDALHRARQVLRAHAADVVRIYRNRHCVRVMDGRLYAWEGTPEVTALRLRSAG